MIKAGAVAAAGTVVAEIVQHPRTNWLEQNRGFTCVARLLDLDHDPPDVQHREWIGVWPDVPRADSPDLRAGTRGSVGSLSLGGFAGDPVRLSW